MFSKIQRLFDRLPFRWKWFTNTLTTILVLMLICSMFIIVIGLLVYLCHYLDKFGEFNPWKWVLIFGVKLIPECFAIFLCFYTLMTMSYIFSTPFTGDGIFWQQMRCFDKITTKDKKIVVEYYCDDFVPRFGSMMRDRKFMFCNMTSLLRLLRG
jgi:hypothetical protein